MSTVCVFLFMYVEVPVGRVGSAGPDPFQLCDTTKSGTYEMGMLIPSILNE